VPQVDVVERERFAGARGGLIQQPPERLLAQRDVAAAEEPLEPAHPLLPSSPRHLPLGLREWQITSVICQL